MGSKEYDVDLVGCDLETGGLNGYFELDGKRVHGALYRPIIELAFILPVIRDDGQLANAHSIVVGIKLDEEQMSRMDPWALEQHTKSGLLDRLESGNGFDFVATSNEEAEQYIIEELENAGVMHFDRKKSAGAMLFGNNIGFDFSFLEAQMPELAKFFHYRKIDISAVNVLSRTIWTGLELPQPVKQLNHTALSDICESLDELNAYTKHLVNNDA